MTDSPEILKWRIQQLTQLVNVSLVLNSTLALDPLLRFIMDSASQLVGAEGTSILLYDPGAQELVFSASSTGTSDALIGQPVPLEGSIAGTILRENRAIALNDVREDARHYRGVDEATRFTTRSILGVPMRMRNEVVGVLEAVNKAQGEWTVQDRSALMILAAQAAVAIDNARLFAALRQANEELSSLDALKNDFIAIASHELRTPLGIILGYASFLRESAAGEASAHAEAVFRSALQLRGIIEQLTNLRYLKQPATVEGPLADLVRDWVAVGDLLCTAEQDVRAMVDAKAQRLVVARPVGDPRLYVDGLKVQLVLANLLNNAVKFTPPGGTIRLGCTLCPQEAVISVQDSGPGIAPEDQARIFDEFVQVEDHLTRRHGGMGLGLSIARALVRVHGGRLWVDSPGPGQGATFSFSLPRNEEPGAAG